MNLIKYLIIFLVLSGLIFVGFFSLKTSQFKFKRSQRDFVYLANILYEQTNDLEGGQEKLMKMTDWLHENVKHVSPYPPGFNGKGVANVIRGGAGNCGFQSCNISVFADMLGYDNHRIYHYQKEIGSEHQHAFAEINVDGKWQVYDPDMMIYQKGSDDRVLGVNELRNLGDKVKHNTFRKIVTQKKKGIFKTTKSWQPTPKAFGNNGYLDFARAKGEQGFIRLLVWKKSGLGILLMSLGFGALLSFLYYIIMRKK